MNPLIGSCSWNYDSWKELIYTKTQRRHEIIYKAIDDFMQAVPSNVPLTIESVMEKKWNRIVEPKDDLVSIIQMSIINHNP